MASFCSSADHCSAWFEVDGQEMASAYAPPLKNGPAFIVVKIARFPSLAVNMGPFLSLHYSFFTR